MIMNSARSVSAAATAGDHSPTLTMPTRVVAAAGQYPVAYLDTEANISRACAAVSTAADRGAQLVVLPELANVGYPISFDSADRRTYFEAAESSASRFRAALADQATQRKITIVAGLAQPHTRLTGALLNVAAVLTPDGSTTVAPKTHLPRIERHYFAHGSGLNVVDTPVGRLGVLICADNSFPESARILALRGAEIICTSYMAPAQPNADLYPALTVTRAFENQCFAVASQASGTQAGLDLTPTSCIAGPDGSLLARAEEETEVVVATLESQVLLQSRLDIPRFQGRRPEIYADLTRTIEDLDADSYPASGSAGIRDRSSRWPAPATSR